MSRYDGLRDRRVMVTGAAHGLGAAIAEGFADQGARLALVDRDRGALDALGDRLRLGPGVHLEPADLADVDTLDAVVARCADALSGLDILVNNAAIIARMPLEAITPDGFEAVLRVNLVAPFFLSRAAMEVMRRGGAGGRIVNVASMAARTGGTSDVFAYAASKGGLLSVTRSLAKVGAADGILVNAILPSNIDSPMLHAAFPPDAIRRTLDQVPLKRAAEPAEVADLVLWLASDASSYVTGASWDINGGWVMS